MYHYQRSTIPHLNFAKVTNAGPADDAKFEMGFIVDPEVFYQATELRLGTDNGIHIDPQICNISVTGSRVLIIRDEAPEMTDGGIFLTETSRQLDQPGAGWVVGVGPMVGKGLGAYPYGWTGTHPTLLLGEHIMFRKFQGIELRLDVSTQGYAISYVWMCDRDILGVDYN